MSVDAIIYGLIGLAVWALCVILVVLSDDGDRGGEPLDLDDEEAANRYLLHRGL